MKSIKRILATLALCAVPVFAQAASTSSDMSVTINPPPVGVAAQSALTLTVLYQNDSVFTFTKATWDTGGNTPTPASFLVTSAVNTDVSLTYPAYVSLTHQGGLNSASAVLNLDCRMAGTATVPGESEGSACAATMPGSATGEHAVALYPSSITFNEWKTQGSYTGDVTISVNY